jgi:TPR repeat protein
VVSSIDAVVETNVGQGVNMADVVDTPATTEDAAPVSNDKTQSTTPTTKESAPASAPATVPKEEATGTTLPNIPTTGTRTVKDMQAVSLLPPQEEEDEFQRAHAMRTGNNTAINLEGALKIYQDYHDRGIAAGTAWVAHMYKNGLGCEKDNEKATKLFQSAAAEGNPMAQREVSFALSTGPKRDRDPALVRLNITCI